MKKLIVISLALLCLQVSFAQQNEAKSDSTKMKKTPFPIETFSKNKGHGFTFSITNDIGKIRDQYSMFYGMNIAYMANHSMEIGFGGTGFFSNQDMAGAENGDVMLWGGYGGLYFAPVIFPSKKIHLTIPVTIGSGAAGYSDVEFTNLEATATRDDLDVYFVAEPGLMAELNVTRFFRLGAGLKYRVTSDIRLENIETFNLNGLTGGLSLKFGLF